MVAKVTQHKNSFTLTIEIDEQTAQRLSINAKSTPDVSVVGNGLMVSAAPEPVRREEVARILGELDHEWGPVFKRLAE